MTFHLNYSWDFLTRHRDGSWIWNKAPVNDNNLIITRYNHSVVFYGSLIIIIEERSDRNNHNSILPI